MPRHAVIVIAVIAVAATIPGTATVATAQTGHWDVQMLGPSFWNGTALYAAGAECCVVATTAGDTIFFHSIHGGGWTWHVLTPGIHVRAVRATGHLALAVGDSVAVAFDAGEGIPHRITLDGAPLSFDTTDPSFACGVDLALVVTGNEVAVYDATLHAWRRLPYTGTTLPFTGPAAGIRDDFAYYTYRTSYDLMPINIVYSHPAHAFATTEHGLGADAIRAGMNHGYAGMIFDPVDPDVTGYVVGYSAIGNIFREQVFTPGYHTIGQAAFDIYPGAAVKREVTAYVAYIIIPPPAGRDDDTNLHCWGFDTVTGTLSHYDVYFDSTLQGMGPAFGGGRVALVGRIRYDDPPNFMPIYYRGSSGSFGSSVSGAPYEDGSLLYLLGGDAFVMASADQALLYFPGHEADNALAVLDHDFFANAGATDSYFTFSRKSTGEPQMTVYIGNVAAHTWTTVAMPAQQGGAPLLTPDVMLMACGPEDVLFYSPSRNSWTEVATSGAFGQVAAGNLALAFSTTTGWLYDAATGEAQARQLGFSSNSVGRHVCVGLAADGRTLEAYSDLTGAWNTTVVDEDDQLVIGGGGGGVLGLVQGAYQRDRYVVYNALADAWTDLHAQGDFRGQDQGARTCLLLRSDRLYAYDPDAHAVPLAIHDLTATPLAQGVRIRWQAAGAVVPADFRLVAAQGNDRRVLAVVRDGSGFQSLDTDCIGGPAGTLVYRLSVRDGDGWRQVAETALAYRPPRRRARITAVSPNPFNPSTQVELTLPRAGHVTLTVHDTAGRVVARLLDADVPAGTLTRRWDGRTVDGGGAAAGTYLVRLVAAGGEDRAKLVLIK